MLASLRTAFSLVPFLFNPEPGVQFLPGGGQVFLAGQFVFGPDREVVASAAENILPRRRSEAGRQARQVWQS